MTKNKYNSPAIILINPQMGENIGASARAMFNCGLNDLRIVNPRDGWPSVEAERNSAGAIDEMPEVRVYNTTKEAIADCHFVLATTARPRDMVKEIYNCEAAAKEIITRKNNSQQTAIIFGAERSGLSNDDISLCNGIINIPLNPDFCSLNLAQAVLLLSYEIHKNQSNYIDRFISKNDDIADMKILNKLYDRLDDELEKHNFYRLENLRPNIMKNLRNMFGRAEPTIQEIKTMHGVISALIGNKLTK